MHCFFLILMNARGLFRCHIQILDETGLPSNSEKFSSEPIGDYIQFDINKEKKKVDFKLEIPIIRVNPIPLDGSYGLRISLELIIREKHAVFFMECNIHASELKSFEEKNSYKGALCWISNINDNLIDVNLKRFHLQNSKMPLLKEIRFSIPSNLFNEQLKTFNNLNRYLDSRVQSFDLV